jgi:hypothetical protein
MTEIALKVAHILTEYQAQSFIIIFYPYRIVPLSTTEVLYCHSHT